jgi:hypothetical protein
MRILFFNFEDEIFICLVLKIKFLLFLISKMEFVFSHFQGCNFYLFSSKDGIFIFLLLKKKFLFFRFEDEVFRF